MARRRKSFARAWTLWRSVAGSGTKELLYCCEEGREGGGGARGAVRERQSEGA